MKQASESVLTNPKASANNNNKKKSVQIKGRYDHAMAMNWVLLSLLFKNYFKTYRYLFFGFGQPVILFAIFYFLFVKVIPQPGTTPQAIIPGYILLAPISISLFSFTNIVSSWKQSVLLKRISITPVSKARLMTIFVTGFLFIALLGTFYMMAWAALFVWIGGDSVTKAFSDIRWGYFFIAISQIILLCNCISLIIAGTTGNRSKADLALFFFYFPSAFLGGLVFPNVMIDKVDALKWISYFSPFKYPSYLQNYAWHTDNIYLQIKDQWINMVVGFGLGVLAFIGSIKFFRWTEKK